VILLRDERAVLDPGDRLTHGLLEVIERHGGPLGLDTGFPLELATELVVAEGQNAAVGVWIKMTSSVPSRLCEIGRERISSLVTTPPAFG
jgi:hypothetical protein